MSITARDGEKGGLGGVGLGCKGDSVHGRESTDAGPRGLGFGVIAPVGSAQNLCVCRWVCRYVLRTWTHTET